MTPNMDYPSNYRPEDDATVTSGAPVTVQVPAESDAVRELVGALDSIINAQNETMYTAMRSANDTIVITMLRGTWNHIKRVADKHRPVDPSDTPAERTEIDV
jgi:hypothetical protein